MKLSTEWFYQKTSIKKLIVLSIVILFITVLFELFIDLHGYFKAVDFFGFHALFGFISCVLMVVFAKLLGYFIKRDENYYDR